MSCQLTIITEIIAPYRIPIFNALARRSGIDLHVMFLAETDPTQRHWLIYKDEINFSYQVLPSWRRRICDHNLLLNWGMEEALLKASPDVIVCGGYNYFASWKSMRWARRNRVPFYLWTESTSRDLRKNYFLVEALKNSFLEGCDGFVVPGRSSADYLREYAVPEKRIFIAPNAVDNDFFSQQAENVRKHAAKQRQALELPDRFLLFVGRLIREKGVFDLLEAYGSLDAELRRELGLVLAGEGPALEEIRQRSRAIQSGSVQIAGFVQRERLPAYYGLAEALVFPTHSDPWGLVVNEAMASGLPVICSDAAGCAADLVETGWNGRIVAPGDIADLASAMLELALNSEQRLRMGQRSRERILEYSPEAWAEGMVQAVRSPGVVAA